MTGRRSGRIRRLQRELLGWGERTRRDLPWRRTRDPWAVLVSEVMLQQTQVARVLPRYESFLRHFPDPVACAAADRAAVVRAWEGLGYNRRAVNLHRSAEVIVYRHAGEVPDDLDDLLALPGVGACTARAVLAFAFERDHGVIDTNAARLLARAVAGSPLSPSTARALADDLVPSGLGWAWNQAVLDLGAAICTKRSPQCGACPIVSACAWALAGCPDPDPIEASAFVSAAQSTFLGSDRQGRGRLVQALRSGPVDGTSLTEVTGWLDDPRRARRVADGLVDDGLATYVDGVLVLPC